MSLYEIYLLVILINPLIFSLLCWKVFSKPQVKFVIMLFCILLEISIGIFMIYRVITHGSIFCFHRWFFLDSLSAYNLLVLLLVFLFTSFYSMYYFSEELKSERIDVKETGKFTALWLLSLSVMVMVLFSNNIALIWIGIEATTLITAFLICIHRTSSSVEAMWKYIIICSVGVAFAFIGTIFLIASFKGLTILTSDLLLWTTINSNALGLNVDFVKISFIFILIGYGTKAGLSPMHTWLPDAHSQAPAPVSALFSGFILSEALYCISRFIPIVEKATNYSGWCLTLLTGMGIFSLIIACIFIPFQKDLKRLLAYSSIEHMGIITIGLGLGGFGTVAALYHTLNHSLSKTLAFYSTGRIGQVFGTHEIKQLKNVMKVIPDWGTGILLSLLILSGIAPFAVFMSELQLIMTAIEKGSWLLLILFFITTSIIFIGIIKKLLGILWGDENNDISRMGRKTIISIFLIGTITLLLLVLGFRIPSPLNSLLEHAAGILSGGNQ